VLADHEGVAPNGGGVEASAREDCGEVFSHPFIAALGSS
jgi:hypothetical protein